MTDWSQFTPVDQPKVDWSQFKPVESSAPIGDLPPDFGAAQVKPAELPASFNEFVQKIGGLPKPEEILPGIGDAIAANAKGMLNPVSPFMGVVGSGTGGDLARTVLSKVAPVQAVGSGLAGIVTGMGNDIIPAFGGTPDKSAADAATEMAQRLSYEPKTGPGKFAGAAIDLPFELFGKMTRAAGEKVQDTTGSPLAATAVDTALQALPILFGGEKVMEANKPPAKVFTERAKTGATDRQPTGSDLIRQVTDSVRGELQKADQAAQQAAQAPPIQPPPKVAPKVPESVPGAQEKPNGPAGVGQPESSAVEGQRGAGGAALGDNQPGQAVQSPAVVPVSASAEAPPPRLTPGVDKSGDVPLAGGVVKPTPRAAGHVAIDKDVPQWIKVPEHVNEEGKTFPESWVDQHEEIDAHEKAEYPNIEALGYQDAHDIHGNAATDAWARAQGMDPAVYKKAQADTIAEARKKAERGEATDVNPALDRRVYEDSNTDHLLPESQTDAGRHIAAAPQRLADATQEIAPAEQRMGAEPMTRAEHEKPSASYSEYEKDRAQGVGFTPEERHASRLQRHLEDLGQLTDEQRQKITAFHGTPERDPVMGLHTRRELAPSLEAAKASGQPSSYGEVDVRGVGGLNAHLKSNSAADPHLRAVADIVQKRAQEAAKAAGGQAVVIRKGGDEIGVVARGVPQEALETALAKARQEVTDYAKANGLDTFKGKEGRTPGLGLEYGVADLHEGRNISDVITEADSLVEARKEGAPYEQRGSDGTPGPVAPEQPAAGGEAGGPVAEARGTESPRSDAEGAAAKPAGQEAAVGAPPDGGKPDVVGEGESRPVSVKNESVEADRLTRGVDAIASEQGPSRAESWQRAKDTAAKDPDAGWRLTQAILDGDKKALTQDEVALLLHDRVRISNEYRAAMDEHDAASSEVDKTASLLRLREAERQLDANDLADRKSGTETSLGLSARQMLANEDYSLARVGQRLKIAEGVDSIEKLPAAVKERMNDLVRQLDEANKKLEQRQQQRGTRKTVDERAQERIAKQMAEYEKTIKERVTVCPL